MPSAAVGVRAGDAIRHTKITCSNEGAGRFTVISTFFKNVITSCHNSHQAFDKV